MNIEENDVIYHFSKIDKLVLKFKVAPTMNGTIPTAQEVRDFIANQIINNFGHQLVHELNKAKRDWNTSFTVHECIEMRATKLSEALEIKGYTSKVSSTKSCMCMCSNECNCPRKCYTIKVGIIQQN